MSAGSKSVCMNCTGVMVMLRLDVAGQKRKAEGEKIEVVLCRFTQNVLMILHYFQNSVEITIVVFVI